MVPLLKFYFHEEVRKAAVSGIKILFFSYYINACMYFVKVFKTLDAIFFFILLIAMPELLRSAKLAIEKGQSQGRNESYLKQLCDYIMPALVEALHKVLLLLLSCFFCFNISLLLRLGIAFEQNGYFVCCKPSCRSQR